LAAIEVERPTVLPSSAHLGPEAIGIGLQRERPRPIVTVLAPANLVLPRIGSSAHPAAFPISCISSAEPRSGGGAGTEAPGLTSTTLLLDDTHRSYASSAIR